MRKFIPALSLAVADICLLGLLLLISYKLRSMIAWPTRYEPPLQPVADFAVGLLIVPILYLAFGLYPGYGRSGPIRFRRRTLATLLGLTTIFFWDYLVLRNEWSRGLALMLFALLLLFGPLAEQFVMRGLMRLGLWGKPVRVYVAGQHQDSLLSGHTEWSELGYRPTPHPAMAMATETAEERQRLIDTLTRPDPGADTIIIGLHDIDGLALTPQQRDDLIISLPYTNVILIAEETIPHTLWATTMDFRGVLGLHLRHGLLEHHNRILKRGLDVAIALMVLPFATVVMGAAALAIFAVDPGGPILYRQTRRGLNGREITVHKLRSMVQDSEARLEVLLATDAASAIEWQNHYKLRRDPRILPLVGTLIRRFAIDELPQIWSVLTGDLSLVGPRPFPEYHLSAFDDDFLRLRHSVAPGLTGLWQVASRDNRDLAAQHRLDRYYILNWSLWLDLHILYRTVGFVFGGQAQ